MSQRFFTDRSAACRAAKRRADNVPGVPIHVLLVHNDQLETIGWVIKKESECLKLPKEPLPGWNERREKTFRTKKVDSVPEETQTEPQGTVTILGLHDLPK